MVFEDNNIDFESISVGK